MFLWYQNVPVVSIFLLLSHLRWRSLAYCEVDPELLLRCYQFRLSIIIHVSPLFNSKLSTTARRGASTLQNVESSCSTINFQHLRNLDVYGVLLVRYHVSLALLISDLSVAGGAMYEVL